MPRGLLLRVGIDTDSESGGDLAPIFPDGRFEYIPIEAWDEESARKHGETLSSLYLKTESYSQHEVREMNKEFGKHWSDFLKEGLRNAKIHHDPKFEGSYTYGECPTKIKSRCRGCKVTPKMRALLELERGDFLIFTAGLRQWDSISHHQIYIIGYLRVKDRIPFFELTKTMEDEMLKKYPQLNENAHVMEQYQLPWTKSLESSVIVVGETFPESRLLEKAIRISELREDKIGRPLLVVGKRITGFDGREKNWQSILRPGSLQRSYTRWIEPEEMKQLEEELSRAK